MGPLRATTPTDSSTLTSLSTKDLLPLLLASFSK